MWSSIIKTLAMIALTLLAFAANSVLCRLALADKSIDASSFTILRITSGAIMLWVLVNLSGNKKASPSDCSGWLGTCALFTYCAAFSFAYLYLDAGIGALVLFGTVQITMISVSLWQSEQTSVSAWLGVLLAVAGFVYLFLPDSISDSQLSLSGLLLMMFAGFGWATYSLNGRNSTKPLIDTAFHFRRAIWLCLPLALIYLILPPQIHLTGVLLAISSGAITSGIGYALWYKVLPLLSRLQAGVIQLCVPLIAALGGIVFISEPITAQFIVSAVLVLGGVLLTLYPLIKQSLVNKGHTVR